ncbi:CCC motif membrane protein [Flavobacteriales bacterium]|nr:CCC motif membrane protein [Flavobacteriales bacterium]
MKQKLPNQGAILTLGIISICTCFMYGFIGLTCGIISLVLAKKSIVLFSQNPGTYSDESLNSVKSGKTCAIIGISLSAIALLMIIVFFGAYITMLLSLFGGAMAAS